MATNIEVFTNDTFGTLRTTLDATGATWFLVADVCVGLDLQNPTAVVARLDEDEKAKFNLGLPGGAAWVVNEAGLYTLILASRKPQAKAFKRWVTHEVLPTIRAHGLYAVEAVLDNDELLIATLERLRSERAARLLAQQALLEAEPKLSYYDVVLQSDSLMTITSIAKDYGLSGKKLNRLLADAGVQFKQSGIWFLYAKYAAAGYTQSKTHVLDDGQTRMHTQWTQKGRLFIYDLLKSQGILPVIEQGADA